MKRPSAGALWIESARLALTGVFLSACVSLGVAQEGFPKLTGRVVDAANVISAEDETRIVALSEEVEGKSTDQIVVATIPSLNGNSIEEYANQLFREWQLGQKDKNNGVLLLIAPNERKVRIEVGYGLEGQLTDAIAKLIIESSIIPRFKANDLSGGAVRGAEDVALVLTGEAADFAERAKRQISDNGIDFGSIVFFIVWSVLFFGVFIGSILARLFGKKIGRNRYKLGGIVFTTGGGSGSSSSSGGGYSGGGGGFSGGGGSSGGGGASGSW